VRIELLRNILNQEAGTVFGLIPPPCTRSRGRIYLQITATEAFFFGVVLAATSVSISVEVLKNFNSVNTQGRFHNYRGFGGRRYFNCFVVI
jgi:Kef-type K+ transport system membrane component KefB